MAVETQDPELLAASEAIWEDLFSSKTYVTGGHGSRHRDEAIGDPYELPSDRAYAETCAAIASFQWNWRLLLATGRARYANAMEQVFWNTIAGAVSREGTEFFYSNTLHLRTGHDGADEDSPRRRLPWYQLRVLPAKPGPPSGQRPDLPAYPRRVRGCRCTCHLLARSRPRSRAVLSG